MANSIPGITLTLIFAVLCQFPAGPSALAQERLPREALQSREWTSSDGKMMTASIMRFDGNVVRLKRDPDGQVLDIPINRFGEDDQRHLIRLRFLHSFAARPLPSGNAFDLLPAGLTAEELESEIYSYFRIGKNYWTVYFHAGHSLNQLPPFAQLRFTFDLTENVETRIPDNQIHPPESTPYIDTHLPQSLIGQLLKNEIDREKPLNLSAGVDSDFSEISIDAADRKRLKDFFGLFRLFQKFSAKHPDWRIPMLDPANYGGDYQAAPLAVESASPSTWTNILDQSFEGSVQYFERDRAVFDAGNDTTTTALRNLNLDSRERLLSTRLNQCYYKWSGSGTGFDYAGPRAYTSAERDTLSQIVVGKKSDSEGISIWIHVPTSNPMMAESDRLSIWPDKRRDPIEISFGRSCAIFPNTRNGITWNQHVYAMGPAMKFSGAIRNCRNLRLELHQGDQSIIIAPTSREILAIQQGLFLHWEMVQLRGLRQKAEREGRE